MLKNQNIICISSIDWDFIWQGHQEIMSTLAASGNRVLFIENTGVRAPKMSDLPRIRKRVVNWFNSIKGIRKIRENLYTYSPLILPFPYSRIARWMNRFLLIVNLKRWMDSMQFGNPIVWTFLPTPIALDIANNVNRKLLIYYCIDNFSASSSPGETPNTRSRRRSSTSMSCRSDMNLARCNLLGGEASVATTSVATASPRKTRFKRSSSTSISSRNDIGPLPVAGVGEDRTCFGDLGCDNELSGEKSRRGFVTGWDDGARGWPFMIPRSLWNSSETRSSRLRFAPRARLAEAMISCQLTSRLPIKLRSVK